MGLIVVLHEYLQAFDYYNCSWFFVPRFLSGCAKIIVDRKEYILILKICMQLLTNSKGLPIVRGSY